MIVVYSDEARADIAAIGIYTDREWGAEQWERYQAQLMAACEQDVSTRIKRAKKTAGFPDVLRWRCGRHFIFFRRTDSGIEVLRILHERMLPSRHL